MVIHSKLALHVSSIFVSAAAGLLAIVLDESVGFSLGVIFVLFSGMWWLGRKLQSLEDRLERAQEWREEVKNKLESSDIERKEILRILSRLPCNNPTICGIPKH